MELEKSEVTNNSNPKTSNQLSWTTGFLATHTPSTCKKMPLPMAQHPAIHKEAQVAIDNTTAPPAESKTELLSRSLPTAARPYHIWPLAQ